MSACALVMTELHVSSFSDYIYDSNILIMGQGIASIFQGMYFTRYLAMNKSLVLLSVQNSDFTPQLILYSAFAKHEDTATTMTT